MDPLLQEFFDTSANEYPVTNKTEDEIKRLTLEEDMPELKRAAHILYRGQAFQKPSVCRNLHNILSEPDAFSKIIPLVSDGILSQSEEMQLELGRSLIKVINTHNLERSQLLELFRITMVVVTLWNQTVLDTWIIVFHEILKLVPYNTVSFICEASIVSLAEQSQHPASKYAAARMIGVIAELGIKPHEPVFDKARFLCQDSEVEVRKIMAQEVILKICRHIGTGLTENKYIEKILELSYDSNSEVKLAAIDSLIEALDILSLEFKRAKIVPVLLEMMHSVNEEVAKKMSFLLGKIIHKLEGIVLNNAELVHQIEDIIKEWINHQNIEIRKNIVYNVPYLIKIFNDKEPLKELYIKAAKDTDPEIRLVAMSSFHEVVKTFGVKESQTILREIFEAIFKEEEIEILEKIVPHLNEFVPVFQAIFDEVDGDHMKSRAKDSVKLRESRDLNKELDVDKSKESTKASSKENIDQKSYLDDLINIGDYLNMKHAWRLEVQFFKAMNACMHCFNIKEVGEAYVNFLFKEMSRGIKEVRKAAIESLMHYLKRNHYSNKTADVVKRLSTEFQESATFQNRVIFLEFYEQACENCSRQFLKTHSLHEKALALAGDKVVEVRKKFLENAVLFKRMLFDEDKQLFIQLDEAIARNARDKNKFISQLAKNTAKELSLLTPLFFEDFLEEDEDRIQREEKLKEKEKEELDMLKRKQQEELFKSRPDNFHVLTTLLLPGRKPGKKYTWNDSYSAKLPRSVQSTILSLDETPKCKQPSQPVSLPAIKPQKTSINIPTLTSKDIESKPKIKKSKISTTKPSINSIEPVVPKKKPASFSMPCKERVLNVAVYKPERKHSRERTIATEPAALKQVNENKPSKMDAIKEALEKVDKNRVRVPTIRKKI